MSIAAPEPRHEYYESQRIRLHYAVWGNGNKPPMLLIHGGEDHCRNWDFLAARLLDHSTSMRPTCAAMGTAAGRSAACTACRSSSTISRCWPARCRSRSGHRPLARGCHRFAVRRDVSGCSLETGGDRGMGPAGDRRATRSQADAALVPTCTRWSGGGPTLRVARRCDKAHARG